MPEALEYVLSLFPDPVLRKVAKPVEAFDDDLRRTADAMFALMFESKGVGLAGPQVGLKLRILVLNHEGDPGKPELNQVLINPRITARRGEKTLHEEGCLSFPSIYAEVERHEECTVEYFDLDGSAQSRDLAGFESRIVQHEFDHLEGILLVDRMSPADKLQNKAALEELIARYKESR